MEISTAKPLRSSSNISDIVSKFAKACKLRSIGVFPSQNPLQRRDLCDNNADESSNISTEFGCEKIHPFKSDVISDSEISELFDIVSALKSAYIRLQEAHVPHDPKMIVAADKLVMTELESLRKLKRAHKSKTNSNLTRFDQIQVNIESKKRLLEELKLRANAKNIEATRLVDKLRKIDAESVRLVLEKTIKNDLNVHDFCKAFKEANESIHGFAKPLISLMKASGWDLDRAAKCIESEAVFSKRSHKKYAFEAYVARRMFTGISMETKDLDFLMRFDDPIDALINDPGSEFAKFCGKKYLEVVHQAMEASFFRNLDHRKLVLSGKHPRTQFYQIFAKMAMRIWVLQGIAGSLYPKPKAFIVKRSCLFSDAYMESVGDEKEGLVSNQIVEFMVMPGFKIGDTLVKSRVYVSKIEKPNGM